MKSMIGTHPTAAMAPQLPDALLSPNGRIDRRTWWIGMISVAVTGVAGISLMNVDSFDDSTNAITAAPTMAAFLWAALAAYVATVLTLKRHRDGGTHRWFGALFAAAAIAILLGWGVGIFAQPLEATTASTVLWALVAFMLPALVEAARRPSRERPAPPSEIQPR